jgi:hypothetical protein
MGFWGALVVCRTEAPLLQVSALMERSEGLESDQRMAGGWRLGCFPGTELAEDVPRMLAELSAETGAPALVGFVLDSDAVVVEGYSTGHGYWRACLAREAMAGYCEEDDLDFDAEYPRPRRLSTSSRRGRSTPGSPRTRRGSCRCSRPTKPTRSPKHCSTACSNPSA